MRGMNKNNVLVTGSNSGFGRLIRPRLARRGHTVFATMRSPTTKNAGAAAELRAVAEAEKLALHVIELDVRDDRSVSKARTGQRKMEGTQSGLNA
jgi:NAD(P)-dependent dehydrogenase (short-subunit alcohol dehydrogenase family)